MTKEELEYLAVILQDEKDWGNEERAAAVEQALKELNLQSCGDMISRSAAIQAIKDMCDEYVPGKKTYHPHKDFVILELEKLPSIKPKTGRWIYDGVNHGLWHYCSECGCDAIVSNWKDHLTPYCPNCGVKMED